MQGMSGNRCRKSITGLTTGLRMVYQRDDKLFLFSAADQCTEACLCLFTLRMQSMSGKTSWRASYASLAHLIFLVMSFLRFYEQKMQLEHFVPESKKTSVILCAIFAKTTPNLRCSASKENITVLFRVCVALQPFSLGLRSIPSLMLLFAKQSIVQKKSLAGSVGQTMLFQAVIHQSVMSGHVVVKDGRHRI